MSNSHPSLKSLIAEMVDNDLEFEKQLTNAIYNGLKELKEQYIIGATSKNEEVIKQIRHKSKPTLMMFEFEGIIGELQKGKELLESEGFQPVFDSHLKTLLYSIDEAIENVESLL